VLTVYTMCFSIMELRILSTQFIYMFVTNLGIKRNCFIK
jgi:hypothetical protein